MKTYPALIEVIVMYNSVITYKENLPFREEPENSEIAGFIKLIRPTTKIDLLDERYFILCSYIEPLTNIGTKII